MSASKSLLMSCKLVQKLNAHVEILSAFNYSHLGRPRCMPYLQIR
jgi:hypothetical protein